MRILLRHGAHKARAHRQGSAPLIAALDSGNVQIAKAFVKAGAETDVVGIDRIRLFDIACERDKSPAALYYLVGLGLYLFARDKLAKRPRQHLDTKALLPGLRKKQG